MIDELRADIRKYWDPKKTDFLQTYFKSEDLKQTKDIFRGLSVPQSRQIAKKYKDLDISELDHLLTSKIHEERLIALFILENQFKKASNKRRKQLYQFYLEHTKWINQWDLIDSSADRILGEYLKDKPRTILYKLAKSELWWERRIAIMATFQFIKELKDSDETVRIAEILLTDKHDLIHKAIGWMLREIGEKVSMEIEQNFLKEHYKMIPRTTLRYAIEKFPEQLRKNYLNGDL